MPDSDAGRNVYERCGALEQEVHTLKSQMADVRSDLKNLPEKVSVMENNQAHMNQTLTGIRDDVGSLKKEVAANSVKHLKISTVFGCAVFLFQAYPTIKHWIGT